MSVFFVSVGFFLYECGFTSLSVLTMRKNALRHEPLSTRRQSPARATDRPASRGGKEECLPSLQGVCSLCI